MKISSEQEMINFGENFAKGLTFPVVIELTGDVGVGKTTFTRGLAKGLGVKEPITSPSFTISKRYAFPDGCLIHYDFYRLSDPGLMAEDILDSIFEPNSVVIVEWADSILNILPDTRQKISIKLNDDSTREIKIS